MSDEFGITDEGFTRKRLDTLVQELEDEHKSVFGDNFNVSPESPDGQIIGVISESNANLWELAEEAYNAFNPSAAAKIPLSNLVQMNFITRLPATSSRVQLTITGTGNLVIPIGSLVSTSDTNDQFSTEIEITLDGGGNGSVFANAVLTGPIQALAGTITTIDTPITGWDTVTNSADATVGTNEETDPDLRARREQSVANNAQAILDAIFAGVANVAAVTQVLVLENDTDIIDGNGLPPHSFQVVVVGGADADIGQAIWENKPAGITSFGTTTTPILDIQGVSHDIDFSRPTEVNIFVEVNLTTDSEYPTNGDDLIKQAIVDYANGDLVQGRGFSLGDDVIQTRLYTPVNSVKGHSIDSIFISTSASPTLENDIVIAATDISNFLIVNIDVNS